MLEILSILVALVSLFISIIAVLISHQQTRYERRLDSYLFIMNLKNQIESIDDDMHSLRYYLKVYLCLNCLSELNTDEWYELLKSKTDRSAKFRFLNMLEPIKRHKYLYKAIWPNKLIEGRTLISAFEKKLEILVEFLNTEGDNKSVQEKVRDNHIELLEMCKHVEKTKYDRILGFLN